MKLKLSYLFAVSVMGLVLFLANPKFSYSQCPPNIGFEAGDFGAWSGTNCKSTLDSSSAGCQPGTGTGFIPCIPVFSFTGTSYPDPFLYKKLSIGAVDQASNALPENSHFVMQSGFDPVVGGGNSLPVVCPGGGTKSVRLGNQQANGGGESLMMKFFVTPLNNSFTYNYAVVLNDGGHSEGQQPYFKIRMYEYNGSDSTEISCATYDVDGNTAKTIGGFTTEGDVLWKPWSAVNVPLQQYEGKWVSIQFITRDCCPTCDASGKNGTSGGGHFAFAYIDAECSALGIVKSAEQVCAGKTVTLSAPEGAKTYSWAGPSGGIVSGQNAQVVTIQTPGTYTVTVTPFGNLSDQCKYTLTASMPENLPGGTNVAVNSVTTCVGGSAVLTASGAASYSWSSGMVGPVFTAPTASAGITTYTVTGSSATCGSGTAVATVDVRPLPTSPFTASSVCVGENSTITYTGNGSASDTYTWDFAGGTATPGTGQGSHTVTWSTAGTKNVTLKVAVGACESPVTTVPVTVAPLKNATFSYNPSTVCKTGGSNPTPTLSGTPGGTFASVNNDANLAIDPTTGVIDIAATPVGTYTVSYTLGAPCPDQSTFVINIVNTPVADFTLGTYCKNEPNPSPTFINGGTAGTFSSSTGLVFVSTLTGEVNLSASPSGTHNVKNTINTLGCPLTEYTNTITINPIPVVTVDNKTICTGGSETLTAAGATNYTWSGGTAAANTMTDNPSVTKTYTVTGETAGCTSTGTGTITVNPLPVVTVPNRSKCEGDTVHLVAKGATTYLWSDGATAATNTITPTASGPYTVTGTTNGCSSTATANVTLNPKPTITVNSPAICLGLSGTLTPAGGVTYIWSDTTFADTRTITPTSAKTYTVYGSTASCTYPAAGAGQSAFQTFFSCWSAGCISDAVSNVTIIQKPVIKVNAPTICNGESVTLNASGASSYNWSNGQSGQSITVQPSSTQTYSVVDNTVGCEGSATTTVTVNPKPTVTAGTNPICAGQNATLTAAGASTYAWSNGATNNPLSIPLQTTTTFTVIGSTPANCKDTTTVTVTVNPLPIVIASNDTICEGFPATITASGANTYVWTGGASGASLTISPTKTTNYVVTGTDANNCSSTGTGRIVVYGKPGADFNADPQPAIVSYPTITFTDRSSKDVTYWHWSFGDGDTLAPNEPNPVHTYPQVETTYTVTLTVKNAGGCPNTVTHEVVIGPEYSFFIPNAFSPNGDGDNDLFFGKGKGIIEYELMIFDRWGNFIFYADDINKGWDGKANGGGDVSQQDTYVWKVNLTDVFKKKHNFIGTVTLLRGE